MTITSQVPRSFFLEVSKGAINGYAPAAFVGSNPSVSDTNFDTIWDASGNYVQPTGGEALEIASDSVNDTLAGSGARKVLINGLDVQHNPQSELVEMNGTTAVPTVRTDWIFVYDIITVLSGAMQTNDDNITLRILGGGDIRAKMLPSKGRSFNGLFVVPAGKTFFALSAQVFIPKNEDVIVRNTVLVDGTNTVLATGDVPVYQNDARIDFIALPSFPAKTFLETKVKSTNAGVEATINIEGILADTEEVAMIMGVY